MWWRPAIQSEFVQSMSAVLEPRLLLTRFLTQLVSEAGWARFARTLNLSCQRKHRVREQDYGCKEKASKSVHCFLDPVVWKQSVLSAREIVELKNHYINLRNEL
jgi:hypothetical protein